MSKPYNIFLSWSGEHAKQIALLLKEWLPNVCREAHCFMSEEDIEKGATWSLEIDDKLAGCQTAIVILTPHSLNSHWVLFEAGALSKGLSKNAVCTLICGLNSIVPQPLGKFQSTKIEKDDFFKLIKSIDQRIGAQTEPTRLLKWFNQDWEEFNTKASDIIKKIGPVKPHRVQSEERLMLEEILNAVRKLDKQGSEQVFGSFDPAAFVWHPHVVGSEIAKNGREIRIVIPDQIRSNLDDLRISIDQIYGRVRHYLKNSKEPFAEVLMPLTSNILMKVHFRYEKSEIICTVKELRS